MASVPGGGGRKPDDGPGYGGTPRLARAFGKLGSGATWRCCRHRFAVYLSAFTWTTVWRREEEAKGKAVDSQAEVRG